MIDISKYIISKDASLKEALIKLNNIDEHLVLFIIDAKESVIGTLTDGDIRRALINGKNIEDPLKDFYNSDFQYLKKSKFSQIDIEKARKLDIKIIPIVNNNFNIIRLVKFGETKTILPLDAVIMAGGEGKRLGSLTLETPKPLLKVGSKPIIEYNIDRLNYYGINNQIITVRYYGNKIIDYCKTKNTDINFSFIQEEKPLGTFGAVSMINEFKNDYILVMNSDLLTNIDYADIFDSFIEKNADVIVASVPYVINLPYAILQTEKLSVESFKEKPSYTYYANAGIYIFKKEILKLIPRKVVFNATDFIQKVIDKGLNLVHYPITSYWLDIGNREDFEKAQLDISHINWD